MNQFSISDVESLSGVKAHTIRIWEKRYGLLKPKRSSTNIRTYSNEDLKTLLNVALLNSHGVKISHISAMSAAEMSKEILTLEENTSLPQKVINELILAMVDLDSITFERLIDAHINKHGIELCVTDIFFPFLEKVGMMWLTSYILPVQEHIISNIIRQKVIVAINDLPKPAENKVQAILFLPPGEYHEIGLLLVHYLLKKSELQVLYLGADVPVDDLAVAVKNCKPSFLYSHIVASTKIMANVEYKEKLNKLAQKVPLYLSGNICSEEETYKQHGFTFLTSYDAVKKFVANFTD